jgi:hypothetical protein
MANPISVQRLVSTPSDRARMGFSRKAMNARPQGEPISHQVMAATAARLARHR